MYIDHQALSMAIGQLEKVKQQNHEKFKRLFAQNFNQKFGSC
jgi:hypothetical protein